jgi:S-adenosylmethionine synthetase
LAETGASTPGDEADARITVETGVAVTSVFTLLERKGFGHPDTLADHLAEELSRAYSRWTLEQCGAVLHHNFDKLALLGGATQVWYGGGRVLDPVRVLVNGRVTRQCGPIVVPVDDLIVETVRSFFARRLPELAGHLVVELNVTSNSSPGAVLAGAVPPERAAWFAPASVDALRERQSLIANDTSLGTGWAPDNEVEVFARTLVDRLSSPSDFTACRPWCGSDAKLMVMADAERLDAVLCVPQKSGHVPKRAAYLANCEEVLEECYRLAAEALPDLKPSFRLNARDIVERDELYLTYTGSSIESGDEGLVGRGNRVNGLITPLRPMNLEGVGGKNPVYHVGKLYNVAARRIAQLLHERFGGYAEVHLASATGQLLARPWQTLIRLSRADVDAEEVQAIAGEVLGQFPALTREIIYGEMLMA